ncbi:hypothetical protein [Haloarchaeobius sp. HRN-SO-5]|uniref:hypothetical protein n=1 Tax=Haloarchaeobius sp. HRN-SO-5 TaxID=3446118 RepID=UPI003EC06074
MSLRERTLRPLQWRAVALGSAVEVVAVAVGLFVPLAPGVLDTGVVLLLSMGLPGGFVAGQRAGDGWRRGAVHGGLVGVVGGLVFAPALWATLYGLVPRARDSAFWGLNYVLATSGVVPPGLVETYGRLVVVLLAALGALLVVVEGVVAGVAATRYPAVVFERRG